MHHRAFTDNVPLREALKRYTAAHGVVAEQWLASARTPASGFKPLATKQERRAAVNRLAVQVERFAATPDRGPIPQSRPNQPWTPSRTLDNLFGAVVGLFRPAGAGVRQSGASQRPRFREPMSQRLR